MAVACGHELPTTANEGLTKAVRKNVVGVMRDKAVQTLCTVGKLHRTPEELEEFAKARKVDTGRRGWEKVLKKFYSKWLELLYYGELNSDFMAGLGAYLDRTIITFTPQSATDNQVLFIFSEHGAEDPSACWRHGYE